MQLPIIVINSDFGRISYTDFEILTHLARIYSVTRFPQRSPLFDAPSGGTAYDIDT